ncbi:GDP-mannose 4,6-dehydratase [Sphingomonas sp. BN140010]|uniref:GDP-mannose 4,6-dehydratase n=1 Tax=Sphingomonas arvum TaxID=2992113 RepID=A0ABT3JD87_9SPHN|nr:NAD-dependent epimerase/dehydratase family protein [Sphingomonas sp. BN140010]MCW3796979.1 GDP-mannose 4,6-dehydratase [Sphingomonas sp. BN140010]
MAILVTGAAGFIGFHTADALLARGEEVIGIDNLNPYYDVRLKQARIETLTASHRDAFQFRRLDFSNAGALSRTLCGTNIDRIVHLGAQAGVRYSIKNPSAYVRANVVGHINILELARAREVRHLVYASSSSVYGATETTPSRVDDRTDRPKSLYAATKRADELMSESYASLFRIPMTGLRFFTVYGPWGRPDMAMWLFTDAIMRGRPMQLFNAGAMRRDFTYVDDIVRGVLTSLDHPPADNGREKSGGSNSPHAIYNLGNYGSENLLDVVHLIEKTVGREAKISLRPMQPGDVPETCADLTASRRDLGFEPRIGIAEGVPRFVDWFKTYHHVA